MAVRSIVTAMLAAIAVCLSCTASLAEPFDPLTKQAAFDDVRFELGNAILTRGLSVHSEGNLGKMLERTGADVGSTAVVFKHAEFITVCSAKYTRLLVEAEPGTAGNCPFVLYAYETAKDPGTVVVGFRRLMPARTDAGRKAVTEVETLLDGIVRDAVK